MTRPLHLTEIQDAIAGAPALLIATDFDGTICSIADTPDRVQTPARAAVALQRLDASPKVVLAVLSGRALADVRSRLTLDAIFAGNHGLEISGKQFDFVHPEAERYAEELRPVCDAVQQAISAWPGAWVENKRFIATVHMRACPPEHWMSIRDAIRTVVRPVDDAFSLRSGRAAFEISPRIGWDKGSALKYIQRELDLEDALTLCIGDDETDETMFRAVADGITIRVCPTGDSDAVYSLPDAAAVTELFEWIADTLECAPRRSSLCRLPRGGLARGARL